MLLALPSCRGPEHSPTEGLELAIPGQWDALESAEPPAAGAWWARFEDEELLAVVAEALANNRDLAVSAARVGAAAAQARIAGADLLPSVGLSGTAARNRQVFVGLPVPGGGVLRSTTTSYGVSLDVSWEADLWGRIAAGRDAASAEFAASAEEYEAARHSIAAQTAKAWFAWREALLQADLAARTVANFRRSATIVVERYERGIAAALDMRLAQSDLAASEALLELRGEQVERTGRQLEILLGRYPAGDLERTAALPALPEAPAAGVPSELLRRRPDLRAAESRLMATDARLEEARAALYPRLVLTGSAGRTGESTSDLLDSDFSIWSIAAGLVQPIFEGGRLAAGVDFADARVRESLANYAALVLRAFAEVETILAIEGQLARRESFQAIASDRALAASTLAEERYARGLLDLTDLLIAQRRALETEANLLGVRRERLESRVNLHLALGGDFETPQALP